LRSQLIEEEAQVTPGSSKAIAARLAIVAGIALAFGLADMRQSFAGCGGYCQARQARALCHHAVRVQGLEAKERDAEFDKCKADPADYLQLEELADDADLNLE
jgi:hypothetical protein